MRDLNFYLNAFSQLNVNRSAGAARASPHKPCMLLAVLGLAEARQLTTNQISFEPPLLERYHRFFCTVRSENDWPNPYYPFFHLSRERSKFWHLKPLDGREGIVNAMESARSVRAITDNVAFAYLDDDLYHLVLDEQARAALREQLVVTWFGSHRAALDELLALERGSDRYEAVLRSNTSDKALAARQEPPAVRDTAFRRTVTQLYDYRCAASGWRILLPDRAMVEAAHLIPFAEAHDDDPRNGIALTPSLHWALDAYIIAPGPDYKWHVSGILDDRISDNQPLIALRGKPLILPRDEKNWPRADVLEWRIAHLRRP